uniref:Uncharacterized protein n=1 Tax=Arundo donax TaxID=35708 RepID=A0A0A9GJU9_ARUDO
MQHITPWLIKLHNINKTKLVPPKQKGTWKCTTYIILAARLYIRGKANGSWLKNHPVEARVRFRASLAAMTPSENSCTILLTISVSLQRLEVDMVEPVSLRESEIPLEAIEERPHEVTTHNGSFPYRRG